MVKPCFGAYMDVEGCYLDASLCFEGVIAGAGVKDYEQLENLPSIEGHTLIGDSTLGDIGAASMADLEAEEQARETLAEQVATLEGDVASVTNDLAGEVQAREQADAALGTRVDDLETSVSNIRALTASEIDEIMGE